MKIKTKKTISLLLALLLLVLTVTTAEALSGLYVPDGVDGYEKGDINFDGSVDTTDVIVLKRHFLAISTLSGDEAEAADLDGSGIIDSSDYILLKQILLGLGGGRTTETASGSASQSESSGTSASSRTPTTTTESEVTMPTRDPDPSIIYKLSYDNITNISKKKNVFVFVIDRFDRVFAETAFVNYPAVFSQLEGFTYFGDNISLYGHTYPSIAYMITGNKFNNDTRKNYFTYAYDNAGTLKELYDNKYQVNVYTSTYFGYNAANNVGKYIANAADSKKISAEYKTTLDTLEEFYADAEFSLVSDKVYSFIHLEGCHDCYFGGGTPPENLKAAQIEKAVNALKRNFAIINKYIEKMKEWGVYDDATIIITGDHGSAISDTKELDGIRTTALFVKRSGSGKGSVVRSSAQVCHDNLWATIFKSEGIKTKGDYGVSVFDVPENAQMTRYYYWHMFGKDAETNKSFYVDYEFTITGTALDFNNWVVTATKKYDRSVYS